MLFGLFGGISPAHSKFSPFDRSVEILGPPQPQPRLITPLARFSWVSRLWPRLLHNSSVTVSPISIIVDDSKGERPP